MGGLERVDGEVSCWKNVGVGGLEKGGSVMRGLRRGGVSVRCMKKPGKLRFLSV